MDFKNNFVLFRNEGSTRAKKEVVRARARKSQQKVSEQQKLTDLISRRPLPPIRREKSTWSHRS